MTTQLLSDTLSHLGGFLFDHAAVGAALLIAMAGVFQIVGNIEARRLSEDLFPRSSRRRRIGAATGRALRRPLSLVRARTVVRAEETRWGRDRRPVRSGFNGGHF